ncbi:MAG: hypothetical protein BAJALOKI3v1_1090001 [Promethearchaeota archaeon]|nr:MAG: hypothetical protein BAJALOKI3v1_1090001 [Candidatus Lokiarchaeota archaeon]
MRFGAVITKYLKQTILNYSDWLWKKYQLDKIKNIREHI